MSKIKNGGLDLYGAGPFEQQQFGTAGVEGVNERKRACKLVGMECNVKRKCIQRINARASNALNTLVLWDKECFK